MKWPAIQALSALHMPHDEMMYAVCPSQRVNAFRLVIQDTYVYCRLVREPDDLRDDFSCHQALQLQSSPEIHALTANASPSRFPASPLPLSTRHEHSILHILTSHNAIPQIDPRRCGFRHRAATSRPTRLHALPTTKAFAPAACVASH